MAVKPGSQKKAGCTRRITDGGDKDRLIAEQKNRIAALENELRLKREEVDSIYVTERKRAGEALAAANRLFQGIIDNTPDIVYAFDLEERFVLANTAVAELLNSTPEQMIGKRRHEFMPREDAAWHEANDRQAIEAGRALEFEEYSQLKGRSITWLTKKFPLRDARGRIFAVAGISADISERKRTEELLSEIEARHKVAEAVEAKRGRLFDVLETLPAMICLLTPDYRVAFANRTFREKFGESRGRHCYEYCFGRSEPCEFCEAYVPLLTGRPHHWEVDCPDGSVIDAYDFPFTDADGSSMILEMDFDITERKTIEGAIRIASAYNRSLIEASLDPLVTIAPDGKITDVNIATEAVTGFPREKLIGTDFSDYFTEPAKAREAYTQAFEKGSVNDYPLEIRHRDGRITPVIYNASVYKDDSGKVIGVFAAARDVTERKQAEMELESHRKHLEDLIKERTRNLEDAKAQAELYLDLMGHDISNMHQIILGQLELAQETIDAQGRLEGEDKELIDTSVRTLQRSAKLIENIRNVQKLRSGAYKFERMDLGDVLDEAVQVYSKMPDRDINIDYVPAHGYFLMANPLLKDIFINLLDNAVKHCEDPVRIGVNVSRIEQNGSRYYQVVVEDNGHGVPDDRKAAIFDRLKRGETRARGTGLGLYIVRTLVEGFNGTVSVEDRVAGVHGEGARFVVRLPIEGGGVDAR